MTPCPIPKDGPVRYGKHRFDYLGDQEMENRWWDYWLKGIDNGIADAPDVKLFGMEPPDNGMQGGGYWLDATFPPAGVESIKFYLGSDGKANSRLGNGFLSQSQTDSGESDQFTYDPANPVPTNGGNLCCGTLLPMGLLISLSWS